MTTITPARLGWVTDEVLQRLLSGVTCAPDAPTNAAPAPYDQSPTAAVPMSSAQDVQDAVARARRVQKDWAAVPFADRARVVLRFHDLVLARQGEVLDLIQWETGKARFSAWQEILQVANVARHYSRRGARYLADRRVLGTVPGLTKVHEQRVPKGVVGVISPWNYPLYLAVGDALPALLAGNGVVSKADQQTPLTVLWAHALMREAGLPAGLWNIVTGDGPVVGGALVDEVDFVCFTGSTRTGRLVGARAGERLIGCSLELGGKNPVIVRADADLDDTVAGIVLSSFGNTGQMCIHLERAYVHEDVYDDLLGRLVAAARDLKVGQTFDYSVAVGSLTSPAQLEAVTAHVEDARAKGARVLTGGRPRPDIGPLAYEPTVLEGVAPGMLVHDEETFGPVLAVHRVRSDDEAVQRANEGCYGLSASIWSRDHRAAVAMAARLRAGSVNVNDGAGAAAGSIEAGMGGMGDSGVGRRHGPEGIRKYTESQTVARQWLMPLAPPAAMSLESFVRLGNAQLRVMRALARR